MIRFYSMFVTDNELLVSPYVCDFNTSHDLTVHRGKTEVINFLLQTTLTENQYKKLSILYDPFSVTVNQIDVRSFHHETIITVELIPKEIGTVKIGFAVPQSVELHRDRLKKLASPLTAIKCNKLHQNSYSSAVK